MNRGDDNLKRAFRELTEGERVPDFDSAWGGAERRRRSGPDHGTGMWRWALAPAIGSAAALLLWGALSISSTRGESNSPAVLAERDGGPAGTLLADLSGPSLAPLPLDGLARESTGEALPLDIPRTTDETDAADAGAPGETIAAADTADWAPSLFDGPTDGLLQLEIPAWDEAGERNVL